MSVLTFVAKKCFKVRGLSGKFVDTACFHSFLYMFQTSLTYYNSVTPERIKYKANIVLCYIYIHIVTVPITTPDGGNRSMSKCFRLEKSNIIYLSPYYHF